MYKHVHTCRAPDNNGTNMTDYFELFGSVTSSARVLRASRGRKREAIRNFSADCSWLYNPVSQCLLECSGPPTSTNTPHHVRHS